MPRLAGKVAIVTGGAGGIGAATAHELAREGAAVAVVDIDEAKANDVADEIRATGARAIGLGGDLADEDAAKSVVQSTAKEFGRIDVLHNNAALTASDFLSRDTTVSEMPIDVWQRSMEVNLGSQLLMCKYAVPEMRRGGSGSIVNMSSGAALSGDRTRLAYGVSKAGVHALTMYVATSEGKQGIRANTIVPGLILTDAVRAHLSDNILDGLGRATLTPYVGQPHDVAELVAFLASEQSRYITGQMIAIDGGMSAHVSMNTGD
ncbi:NAD(P)-dependent dehydrogenase, short-chain alcohol dehydrogenase family [Mycobacterium rhizamassiliense]|jgi:NAD(P)-dependent dehydrogenase (short-subunit alcohol dehydrogenase family)|uniref:NAD(P)-dependent dehydrogenase, short-chain alcohol dehydrogenase family n=1 Tax=Mycobacterium rhizamassiliense TaxID=1841860 RepID=A0A2U3NVR9_9MYCO|nr:SDR family NAD(P)-dependent oxidoreductase [Mycobacterium rhizamassiliense]SPM35610.1 NAD(P)-dependent dehydrogenase, short-chain alcohol dehydrogenase family [Mycobacterium rhizamassiliense]